MHKMSAMVCLPSGPPTLRRAAFVGLAFLLLQTGNAAGQATPIVKVVAGTLISPTTALATGTFGSATSPAAPTTRDPLVRALARSLKYNIDEIQAYAHDHVELTPLFGLQKGARGVILDGYGSPFDQAHFLVEMLRESDANNCPGGVSASCGYNPRYVLGQITLTGAQLANWFGISTDATLARHVLADGGFPAVITGSGANFSVTMSHIWVGATISGTSYVFDPAYKIYATTAAPLTPAAIQSAMGYNATTLYNSGAVAGSTTTASQVKGFSTPGFKATLDGYRANLEVYLNAPANQLIGVKVDALVGHRSIVAQGSAPIRVSSLPYAVNGAQNLTWTGQIPNVYRSSLTVNITGWANSRLYYADEIYGEPIALGYGTQFNGTTPPATPFVPLTSTTGAHDCAYYRDVNTTASPTVVSVAIYHPYPTGFMNRTLTNQLSWRPCASGRVLLTNHWGDIGGRTLELMRRAAGLLGQDSFGAQETPTGPVAESTAVAFSKYLSLAGKAQSGLYQLHDLIGIHQLDDADSGFSIGGGAYNYGSRFTMLTMDFEAAVSVNPTDSYVGARRLALARVAVGGLSMAEAAAARDESDGVRDATALTLFVSQYNSAVSGGGGPYPYYLATASNWSTVQASLAGYGSYPGSAALPVLTAYINAGYSLIVPQQGMLTQPPYTVVQSGVTQVASLYDTFGYIAPDQTSVPGQSFRRAAFYAFNSTTGDGAYIVYDPRRRGAVKGGVDVALSADQTSKQMIAPPDAPKPKNLNIAASEVTVDGKTGGLTYAPPPDISDGAGEFPRKLVLQRAFNSMDTVDHGFGVGWDYNWDHHLDFSNDAMAALGESGGFGAVSALVEIQASIDMVGSADPAHWLASAIAHQWLVDQTINNVATVNSGISGRGIYLRRLALSGESTANGYFQSARADGSMVTLLGAPTDSILNRRVYSSLTATFQGRDGDIRTYGYVTPPYSFDAFQPLAVGVATRKSFYLTTWLFPDGMSLSTTYVWGNKGGNDNSFNGVTNTLGASIVGSGSNTGLELIISCQSGSDTTTPGKRVYTSSSGSFINFNFNTSYTVVTACPADGTPQTSSFSQSVLQSFSDAVSSQSANPAVWSYAYTPISATFPLRFENGVVDQPSALNAVYKPSSPPSANAPAIAVTYDIDGQTKTVSDALGGVYSFYSSPVRSERRTPLGSATITNFDEYGRAVRTTDPLGRVSANLYDTRDRVVQTTRPGGDYTVSTYDLRSNVLSRVHYPYASTPPAAQASITTSAIYPEQAVTVCVVPATCNKPTSQTDGGGNSYAYQWNPTTGQLAQILRPADAFGNRPQTDLAYSMFGGVSLLTSKTDKVTATQSVTTAYAYDAANNYALKTATADSGGLALRSCFKFDATGNLIGVTDPRAATCP